MESIVLGEEPREAQGKGPQDSKPIHSWRKGTSLEQGLAVMDVGLEAQICALSRERARALAFELLEVTPGGSVILRYPTYSTRDHPGGSVGSQTARRS
jgi:hypothetical protein